MPIFVLDKMEETSLPAGEYTAKIDDVSIVENKYGLPVAQVRFVITHGQHEGNKVFRRYNLPVAGAEEKAGRDKVTAWKRFLIGLLGAMGITTHDKINTDKWVGSTVRIELAIREFQGAEQTDVKSVKAPN